MKIMCYQILSLNRNTLNINENWCEITIPTKSQPYLKASKHPEIDWSNARGSTVPPPGASSLQQGLHGLPGLGGGGRRLDLAGGKELHALILAWVNSMGWGLGVGDWWGWVKGVGGWWWLMIDDGWEDHVISKSVSLSSKGTVINGRSYWMGTY